MSLKENTLFGKRDKVQESIALLQKHAPSDKPYWLAFSGGKDSICIYRLAEMAGVDFEPHYNFTTVDPPELVRFIKKEYPQVAIDKPKKSMFQLIEKKGPPRRNRRWCCAELKEKGGIGYTVITGIRAEESPRRAARAKFEPSIKNKNTWYVNPIMDWTMLDIWDFIEAQGMKYCSLYDEGFDRIGCILCPMTRTVPIDKARWPKFYNAYKHAFKRFWDKKESLKNETRWKSFEDFWHWWLDRDAKTVDLNQQEMF